MLFSREFFRVNGDHTYPTPTSWGYGSQFFVLFFTKFGFIVGIKDSDKRTESKSRKWRGIIFKVEPIHHWDWGSVVKEKNPP